VTPPRDLWRALKCALAAADGPIQITVAEEWRGGWELALTHCNRWWVSLELYRDGKRVECRDTEHHEDHAEALAEAALWFEGWLQ